MLPLWLPAALGRKKRSVANRKIVKRRGWKDTSEINRNKDLLQFILHATKVLPYENNDDSYS